MTAPVHDGNVCIRVFFFIYFLFYKTALYHSSAGNVVRWCWVNSHWLVAAFVGPLSLSSQCECLLLLKLLPVQNWAFEAQFHQIPGQLPALRDRKGENFVKGEGTEPAGKAGSNATEKQLLTG